jgi:hypothetical protein
MKCENCPYFALEGIENNMNWCKLYSAEAPIEGCEAERDTFIKEQEMFEGFMHKNSTGE